MATKPSAVHQNTRCGIGASTLPPAAMMSMIKEPRVRRGDKKDDCQEHTDTEKVALSTEVL